MFFQISDLLLFTVKSSYSQKEEKWKKQSFPGATESQGSAWTTSVLAPRPVSSPCHCPHLPLFSSPDSGSLGVPKLSFVAVQSLSCVPLCDPMDCSTPGFSVHHQLPEFTQPHVRQVGDAIQPSRPLSSPCLQSYPASGSFPVSQFFTLGGQSIGVSASTSVLPRNSQD